MKELQELRNEVLSLRNMGEITKQTESILLHKLNALKAAINYTHSCTELKEKKAISFRDWVNQNKYTRFGNGYQRNEIVFSKEEMWQRFENRN